jgi:hypothetical protein
VAALASDPELLWLRVRNGRLVSGEWAELSGTRSVYTGALNYPKRQFYVGLLTGATSQRFVTVVVLVFDSRRLVIGYEVSIYIRCSS